MKKKTKKTFAGPLFRFVLWAAVFLVLAVAADQALFRLSIDQPLIRDFQDCYRDFRSRLLQGNRPGATRVPEAPARTVPKRTIPPRTIEAVIDREAGQPVRTERSWLYVDREGTLQFVDSLEEVPAAYRRSAQPLAE